MAENEPCDRVVWEGRGPVGSHAKVVYGFEKNGEGTRFSYRNEFDLPGGRSVAWPDAPWPRATAREVDGSLQSSSRLSSNWQSASFPLMADFLDEKRRRSMPGFAS